MILVRFFVRLSFSHDAVLERVRASVACQSLLVPAALGSPWPFLWNSECLLVDHHARAFCTPYDLYWLDAAHQSNDHKPLQRSLNLIPAGLFLISFRISATLAMF
jgi:hypothetical protein